MNSSFREIPWKAHSVEDRTPSCLCVHPDSFKHQQTCTQSAIEDKFGFLVMEEGGLEYSPVFSFGVPALSLVDWCATDKNIHLEKVEGVVLSE